MKILRWEGKGRRTNQEREGILDLIDEEDTKEDVEDGEVVIRSSSSLLFVNECEILSSGSSLLDSGESHLCEIRFFFV